MEQASTHEDVSRTDEVKSSSDRSFGLVFTVVFTLVGLWPLLSGNPIRVWALAVAGAFLIVSVVRPATLKPLNRLWFLLGLLLHRIVSPVVLGILFFLTITPIGLLMRLLGKNPLRLGFDPQAASYWIPRRPPGPAPDSMRNQF